MGKFNLENVKEVLNNKDQYLNATYIRKHKSVFIKIAVSLVVVVAIGANAASGHMEENNMEQLDQIEMEQEEEVISDIEEESTIIVDVSGAVDTPMVVELPGNARINDAIKAAGGLTDDADISNVNRAQTLDDGQKVYIPPKGGPAPSGEKEYIADNFIPVKVNLNTATSEELRTLDGVGPATAEKIIRYREAEGPFKKIEDIKNVKGIGDKTFDKLKDDIVV